MRFWIVATIVVAFLVSFAIGLVHAPLITRSSKIVFCGTICPDTPTTSHVRYRLVPGVI